MIKLGIVGTGRWGDVYAKTLRDMGIPVAWQAGGDWRDNPRPDGVIVASAAESHYSVALSCIEDDIPVLIEKPVCLSYVSAKYLLELARANGCIAFTGHTRLYSNAWRAFKAMVGPVESVDAEYGGESRMGPLLDKGSHLVAMCYDLGFDPLKAVISIPETAIPLRFTVNGEHTYRDVIEVPMPLNVLVAEFVEAIEVGLPNVDGLELGAKVAKALDIMGLECNAQFEQRDACV